MKEISQIDKYITELEQIINTAIERTVPIIKSNNNIDKYINNKVKKLHNKKKKLVTLLYKYRKTDPFDRTYLNKVAKALLKQTRELIYAELRKASEKCREHQLKKIDHRNTESFFLIINRLFRNKNSLNINELYLDKTKTNIYQSANCDLSNVQENGTQYIFTTPTDKLNILGAYYEHINSPRHLNNDIRLKEIVEREAKLIKKGLASARNNNTTISTFFKDNSVPHPSQQVVGNENIGVFCNY